jgi:ATP-binding cassette, subfamily B, heavy metal transporter
MRSESRRRSLTDDPANIKAFRRLLPYLWEYRRRLVLALSFLIFAKLANVSVPLVLKQIVDGLNQPEASLIVPAFLLIGYGLLRFSMTLFTDLRDVVFARVTQRAIWRVALEVFQHLHALSLRFHLERQTGGVSRDIERGTRGIESLMRFLIFSIFPTLLEMALVDVILVTQYDIWFALITLGTLVIYIVLTVSITEWRTKFRRASTACSTMRRSSISAMKNSKRAVTTITCNAGRTLRCAAKRRLPASTSPRVGHRDRCDAAPVSGGR